MLASKPSVAALGNLANLPKFEEIERAFGNRGNFSGASRFFLFRNWWHGKPSRNSFNHCRKSMHVDVSIQRCTSGLAARWKHFVKLPKRDPAFSNFNNFTSAGEWPSLQVLSKFITLEITSKKKHVKKRVTLFSDPLLYPPLPSRPQGQQTILFLKLDPIFFKDHTGRVCLNFKRWWPCF